MILIHVLFCFLDNNSKLEKKFHEGEDIIVNF